MCASTNNKETRGRWPGLCGHVPARRRLVQVATSGPRPPPSRTPFTHLHLPRGHTAPASQVCWAQPDPPVAPLLCPPVPHLSFLSLKPPSAQSAPLQAPQGSRPRPGRLTAATAQPEHFFRGHGSRIPSGSLALVPKALSSTLEKEALLDACQLWPQPREQPCGWSFCSDVTSGGLL